jgi:HK97 family phage prohead protease
MDSKMHLFLKKAAPARKDIMPEKTTAMLKFMPANDIEMKALGDAKAEGFVAGWASTPDRDLYDHIVHTGAFDASIKARGISGPAGIKLLIGHDWNKVGGVITVLETRNGRLWLEAQLNLNISYAKDAYEACKINGGLNFSVGFMLQDYEFKEETVTKEEMLHIYRGDLFEVSVVPFPGNEACTMDVVKTRQAAAPKIETFSSFEKLLVSSGLAKSRNEANRILGVVKSCSHLFQAETPPNTPVVLESSNSAEVVVEAPAIETTNEEVVPVVPETKQAPLLDATKLNDLTQAMLKLKNAL